MDPRLIVVDVLHDESITTPEPFALAFLESPIVPEMGDDLRTGGCQIYYVTGIPTDIKRDSE